MHAELGVLAGGSGGRPSLKSKNQQQLLLSLRRQSQMFDAASALLGWHVFVYIMMWEAEHLPAPNRFRRSFHTTLMFLFLFFILAQ